ncbi:MAG: DNA repair protein RecN [Porphyromonadaceae bacterium CG2_30_38_12]|nr:MAG: DNA repair protein RecN [Porphyromonadaceae bacterium CG2_30_38_12]
MLKSIYISNYALISELTIDFESGFSTITGETGAGKSIIIGALSLILGQRAETKAIKTDSEKCIIEATFNIASYKNLRIFFENNDIDFESENCIIRRELTAAGKSRAFVNDTPVSLIVLRELTTQLIDIHSQHDNLLLSNPNYQLDVVDMIAQNSTFLSNYVAAYHAWQAIQNELNEMENNAKRYGAELDFIQYQYTQLIEANLEQGEQENLENEQDTLMHAEEIKTELFTSQLLFDEEKAILSLIKEVSASISKIKNFIPASLNWLERIETAYIELKDVKAEMASFAERVEDNPERLRWVENRLSELFTLQKKYKVATVDELITLRNEFESQLEKIESFDEDIALLKQKLAKAWTKLELNALELSNSRQKVCTGIENYMVEKLMLLGMPHIQFKVEIVSSGNYTLSGNDDIQFLFSANKNRELQAVQLIASGGEVSRLMLSIKALIANKSDLPTIIFDEIDTGVSGEIAHRMGEIMRDMSNSMQVITITHLPQIAAKSSFQYRVFKDDSGLQTQTYIERLSDEMRVNEIAHMLSGKNISEISILNAKELLTSK